MTTRNTLTSLVGILTIIAIVAFGATLARALFISDDTEVPVPDKTPTSDIVSPYDLPDTLRIPSLEITAAVQHVGVTANGTMANPTNFTDVGWYKFGPAPGKRGSAVMAGHVDNGLALDGVFKHLGDLKKGDDIYVVNAGGKRLHFVVEDVVSYPYKDVPLETLFKRADKARLNLVTCEGNWVKKEKTYDQRLVVYTTLASD